MVHIRQNLVLEPASLLREHVSLLTEDLSPGPVLDLACGECHNGIFLAGKGLEVVCCDRSRESLDRAQSLAQHYGVNITTWELDLEIPGADPLPEEIFSAILVFRYLHRPLVPGIKKALRAGGILIYETFTIDQPQFGKPRNPDFLLDHGELMSWFRDWEIIHAFEGIKENPNRAIAQIVCRKENA